MTVRAAAGHYLSTIQMSRGLLLTVTRAIEMPRSTERGCRPAGRHNHTVRVLSSAARSRVAAARRFTSASRHTLTCARAVPTAGTTQERWRGSSSSGCRLFRESATGRAQRGPWSGRRGRRRKRRRKRQRCWPRRLSRRQGWRRPWHRLSSRGCWRRQRHWHWPRCRKCPRRERARRLSRRWPRWRRRTSTTRVMERKRRVS